MLLLITAIAVSGFVLLQGLVSNEAVSRQELVVGEVTAGSLLRDVRAAGTLEPADLRWIAAGVEGRVEYISAQAGEYLKPDSVIMVMSNPRLLRDLDTARIELEVLEAEARVLEKRLVRDLLTQQAVVAEYESQYENARFRMEANQTLANVVSAIDARESELLTRQYEVRLDIEKQRLGHLYELQEAELEASRAGIQRARRQVSLQEELLASLTVRAGIEGVLQEVPAEPGQQIATGAPLARVARQDEYKALLRVQESQAREVQLGQKVIISAGGQQVPGAVSRIDPAVQEGVVLVDVRFTGSMLPGARPDLRVQGAIEIDHVENTLVMPRPVFSEENSTQELFVIDPSQDLARRVQVRLGIGSVDRIQVLNGLQPGDRVVVSDMTRYQGLDTLSLEN